MYSHTTVGSFNQSQHVFEIELFKLGLVEKVVKVKISLTGILSYENIFGCKVEVLGLRVRG